MKRLIARWGLVILALAVGGGESAARGDVKTQAVRETTEFVLRKFAKESAEEGAERLAARIESLAARHGDEALEAVKNVGPRALRVAEEAGEQSAAAVRAMARYGDEGVEFVAKSPKALELASRYGDEAAEVIVKHKGAAVAEPLVEQYGKNGIAALRAVEPQAGRRLAMMTADGELRQIGRADELLAVVGRYGDKAANFIWNNKGALAVTAALTAFLADPQPFLDGTAQLADVVGEHVIEPTINQAGGALHEAAARTDWTVAVIVVVMMFALVQVWRSYLRHRAALRRGVSGS